MGRAEIFQEHYSGEVLDAAPQTELSFAILRSARIALEKLGLWREVSARLPPETLALVLNPPALGWVDGAHYEAMVLAVHALRGDAGMIEYTKAVTLAGVEEIRGGAILQGVLRLFGPSPHALLSRMDQFNQKTARGVSYAHEKTGDRSCVVQFTMTERRDVPLVVFRAQLGVIQGLCQLLGHKAECQQPVLVQNGKGNSARIAVRW